MIKKEEAKLEEMKKKNKSAWAKTVKAKTFGLKEMFKFTWPRIWTHEWPARLNVFAYLILVLLVKATNVLLPLIMKVLIDNMTCKVDGEETKECPSPEDTYTLILLYAACKFVADTFNYLREIPFANMSAKAEVSIAYDVYDHVQR